jgi:hypothetical protein
MEIKSIAFTGARNIQIIDKSHLLRIARYDIPCPCCGKTMLDKKHLPNKMQHNGRIATIEHVRAKSLDGEDKAKNWMLECGKDNWTKSNKPLTQQINENPLMLENLQKHFDKLIILVKQKRLDKKYVMDLAQTIFEETSIRVDASKLQH